MARTHDVPGMTASFATDGAPMDTNEESFIFIGVNRCPIGGYFLSGGR